VANVSDCDDASLFSICVGRDRPRFSFCHDFHLELFCFGFGFYFGSDSDFDYDSDRDFYRPLMRIPELFLPAKMKETGRYDPHVRHLLEFRHENVYIPVSSEPIQWLV
jgi:hypothetical protein